MIYKKSIEKEKRDRNRQKDKKSRNDIDFKEGTSGQLSILETHRSSHYDGI